MESTGAKNEKRLDIPMREFENPSLVAHIVVVGFHAQLGNRIEFAYPRLRGETLLRSPKLSDTSDISDSPTSPAIAVTPSTLTSSPSEVLSVPHHAGISSPNSFSPAGSATPIRLRPLSSPYDAASLPPKHQISRPSSLFSTPSRSPLVSTDITPTSRVGLRLTPPASSPARGDWGVLPEDWGHLPFMALPDGAHELTEDIVFFTLPPDVHCVSCFRQIDAIEAVTHSASSSNRKEENSVAARGSVQKSVVLLCRRPLFGLLASKLVPAVRAYFEQRDFARTDILASLFHSLNISLSHPGAVLRSSLFHGISVRAVLQSLGPQTLAVLKLILLEKRVVIYSQPVQRACSTLVALASLFPGASDTLSPKMPDLDTSVRDAMFGFPLALFGARDRVIFQPYAPLPVVSRVLRGAGQNLGCVVGTSHNVGVLLASTAAHSARKAAASCSASADDITTELVGASHTRTSLANSVFSTDLPSSSAPSQVKMPYGSSGVADTAQTLLGQFDSISDSKASPQNALFGVSRSAAAVGESQNFVPAHRSASTGSIGVDSFKTPPNSQTARKSSNSAKMMSSNSGGGRLPVADALVNLSTGKISVSSGIEPLCRITRQERRLFRDLIAAASASSSSFEKLNELNIDPEEYIRTRVREYLRNFLGSVATLPGILGGPRGGETWSSEMISHLNVSPLVEFNENFVRSWLQTRNAACWARCCNPKVAALRSVPKPEIDESLMDEPLLPVERVTAGVLGIRNNVAELGRLSNTVSTRAMEGLSSFFNQIEIQMVRIEAAIGNSIAAAPMNNQQRQVGSASDSDLGKVSNVGLRDKDSDDKESSTMPIARPWSTQK